MNNKKSLRTIFVVLCLFLGLIFVVGIGVVAVRNIYTSNSYTNPKTISDGYYGGIGGSPLSSWTLEAPGEYEQASMEMDSIAPTSAEYEVRNMIKTGDISVAVGNIDETLQEITEITQEYQAYTVNQNDYGKGINRSVNITIKVEESKFENLYSKLKTLDGEFIGSSISVSDVTDTVMDLEARLKNYRSVEAQYLKILEMAETVEDTLAVQKELNQVRLDIERVEAQLKNLGTQTDYSYIYINISQSSVGAELADDEWKPGGIFKEAARALVSFGKFFGSVLIWIVVFSPVIAVVVVPLIVLKKKAKK